MILIPGIAHIPGLSDSVVNLLLFLLMYIVHRCRSSFRERLRADEHAPAVAQIDQMQRADARTTEWHNLLARKGFDLIEYESLILGLNKFVADYTARDGKSFEVIKDSALQTEMQRLFNSLEGSKGLFAQAPQHAAELEGYLSCFAGARDERGMDPSVLVEALKVLLKETHAVSVGSGGLEPPSPVSL